MNVVFRTLRILSRSVALSATVLAVLGLGAAPLVAATSNGLMDISADGRLLVCTNRDSGTVTVVDLESLEKLREIPVGKKPEGVTFIGDSHRVAVAVYAEDRITFLNADNGKILATLDVFDEPYGLVSTPDGSHIFATLEYPGQIIEIDPEARTITRTFDAGEFLRGIALDADRGRVYVTEYLTATVKAVDLASGEIVDEWPGLSTDNLARQVVPHPHRPKLYVPHIRSKITEAHGNGSIFPYVSVIDTRTDVERRRGRVPMDSFRGVLVTANPWAAAVSPDGSQFYVLFSGTDDLFVCNTIDDDYREIEYRGYIQTGRNPRCIRVAPDGKSFYILNALDFNIVRYSTDTLRETGSVVVTENPLSEDVWRGKVLFYSANQPMASRRWIACASCHPDGQPDGRTWQNPEGLRNTQSLGAIAWTHPIHWSADRDEVQDFEHTIRGDLMQGRGLLRGKLNDPLGEPNKGLSHDLDCLAAYANTHKVPLSPHSKNGLSESARRGRELFFSEKTQCATCHSGPYFCDSQPGSERALHDVGTGEGDPSEIMGPAYDTPTLLGIYRTAPYLHRGQAKTLEDVLTTYNKGDRHGVTSHLTEQEIHDLAEFLRALPYEDPEPAAKAAGLTKITR